MRQRLSQINRADRLVEEAEFRLKKKSLTRRAARLFDAAGDLYKSAGLGLAARKCYSEAKWCWAELGKTDLQAISENKLAATPTYWE